MQIKQLNAKQEAKLNSQRSTEQHVDANISIISGIAAFAATYNKIKANIASLLAAVQQKSAALTGIASGKTNFRQTLSSQTVTIAGLVETYASDIGNDQLREEMHITESRLKRTRDEFAPLCQFVHDRAAEHLDALKDYNLNAAKLAALQTAIDNYKAEVPKPRTAISNRKTTTANIAALLKDNDKLFEKFDKQIESLRADHPDFVNTYFSTRNVINPTAKSKKPKDAAETNKPD
jgi:DNA repair exonuclease SbcCD ATPase subunit